MDFGRMREKPAQARGAMRVPIAMTIYKRLYAEGRIDVAAEGEPEYEDVIRRALENCCSVRPVLNPRRFLELLISGGVPTDVAKKIAETLSVDDDAAYCSPHPPRN